MAECSSMSLCYKPDALILDDCFWTGLFINILIKNFLPQLSYLLHVRRWQSLGLHSGSLDLGSSANPDLHLGFTQSLTEARENIYVLTQSESAAQYGSCWMLYTRTWTQSLSTQHIPDLAVSQHFWVQCVSVNVGRLAHPSIWALLSDVISTAGKVEKQLLEAQHHSNWCAKSEQSSDSWKQQTGHTLISHGCYSIINHSNRKKNLHTSTSAAT